MEKLLAYFGQVDNPLGLFIVQVAILEDGFS
jgi:hypothetical protein